MKRILFIVFTFLSINLFAQIESANRFRTSTGILESVLGTNFKKDTVIVGGKKILVYRQPNTDTYHTVSAVNDSLRFQKWKFDTISQIFLSSNLDDVYIDNVINKNEVITTLSNTLSTGHNIGTYTNESGTAIDLKESIVSISKIPFIGYRLKKEDGKYDTITFNQTKYIALRDTSNCTAWNYGTLAVQTNAATADSLFSIVINGVTYPINYPIDDGGTGDIPPATASALETLISGIISSVGYSATFTVTSPTIFTQFDHILTAGNSPMSITYNYSLGGFNATSTVTSYPIACDFTPRNFTAADNAYAQSKCPFLTFAYTTGALDTLRAWDCKSNGWQIISSESPDVITSIQNTITGHKIADYTNESNIITNINESVIGVVNNADGSTTITKEDGSTATIPTQNATNDLRKLTDGTIVRGSDDPYNAKGSQFTSSIYNYLSGFGDYWIGSNGATNEVFSIDNTGYLYSKGKSTSEIANKWGGLGYNSNTGSLLFGIHSASNFNNTLSTNGNIGVGAFLDISGGQSNAAFGQYSSIVGDKNGLLASENISIIGTWNSNIAGISNNINGTMCSNLSSQNSTIAGGRVVNIASHGTTVASSAYSIGVLTGFNTNVQGGNNSIYFGGSNNNVNGVNNVFKLGSVTSNVSSNCQDNYGTINATTLTNVNNSTLFTTENTTIENFNLGYCYSRAGYIKDSYSWVDFGLASNNIQNSNLGVSIGEGIKQSNGGSRIYNFGTFPVEYTGQNQNPTFFDFDDILYNFGSGNSDGNRRSVFTIWKNGKIKINQKNHNNTSNHLFSDINPTTVLDIDGDRGIRIPRLTAAQIALIPSPEDGEEVYCTDCLGSNGSAGAKQHYQASTSSWRTFTTF